MNILLVLSGPSGVGKGTLKERLMARGGYVFSVSCTTRAPRGNERDGVDYFFVTEEEFARRKAAGDFLESDEHFGSFYGTPKSFVEEQLATSSVLLDIDVVGALNIKKSFPQAVLVFIAPPSKEALKKRLFGRGAENGSQMELRLARVDYELSCAKQFDHIIVNDDLDEAERELYAIAEKYRAE